MSDSEERKTIKVGIIAHCDREGQMIKEILGDYHEDPDREYDVEIVDEEQYADKSVGKPIAVIGGGRYGGLGVTDMAIAVLATYGNRIAWETPAFSSNTRWGCDHPRPPKRLTMPKHSRSHRTGRKRR